MRNRNMYIRMTKILNGIFILASIADLVLTKIALAHGGTELNPVASFMFSIGLGEVWKIFCIFIIVLCIYSLIKLGFITWAFYLSGGITIFMLTVMLWNIFQVVG